MLAFPLITRPFHTGAAYDRGSLMSRSPFHAGARWCGKGSVKIGIIRSVTPLQLSRLIANAAADKKARGIVRLDIRQKSSIADYFVICEGDTDRQVRAITDSIVEACQAKGVRPLRTAGYQDGSLVALDYARMTVPVFLP